MTTPTALLASNPITLNGAEPVWLDKSDATLTGAATTQSIANLFKGTKGANIASATTPDLGAATGNYVHITGTETITGFGTATAGIARFVVFDGALTLTHNGTSLILPTAANITTVAGDCALFVSEGSGNWKCVFYQRASGQPLAAGGVQTPFGIACSDMTTDLTTGTGKAYFRAPYAMENLTYRASLFDASSSGAVTIDINKNGSTVLSTKLTIDATEKTSTTAATPYVATATTCADDDEFTIDIDGAGADAKGLIVWFIGNKA